jgi:sterol 3beta-glucosyltransferase
LLTPQQENGVDAAVQSIYRDLEYATNLMQAKAGKNKARRGAAKSGGGGTGTDGSGSSPVDVLDDDEEESWTFVGGDAETIDDLSSEAVLKRTAPDLKGLSSGRRALGSRVLGGSAGGSGMRVRQY